MSSYLGLVPLVWHQVIDQMESTSPYVYDVLEYAFEIAAAVVIILTPDENVTLHPALRTKPGDDSVRSQARQNVLFEAGMAFMKHRDRTILLNFGSTDVMSDLKGVSMVTVRRDDIGSMRWSLARRLSKLGFPIEDRFSDGGWADAGDFSRAFLKDRRSKQSVPDAKQRQNGNVTLNPAIG